MKAFILAGGFATRLWPLTEHRAKPMLLVDGRPILAHILEKIPQETETFLLTNSRFAPDFETYLETVSHSVQVFREDAHSDTDKLGALAAVSAAIKHFEINDDLLILAGDNLLPALNFSSLAPEANQARLAVYQLDDRLSARSFGVVELGKKREDGLYEVAGFEEKPEQPKSSCVSTGFMGIGKQLIPALLDFSTQEPDALGGVIPEFLRKNLDVLAQEVDGDWFDVGSYEAYLAAHKCLQQQDVVLEDGAELHNTQCQGKVYIAAGAKVQDCVLVDAVVYPNTILADCHISQSVIDQDCHLEGVDLSRKLVRQRTTLQGRQETLY